MLAVRGYRRAANGRAGRRGTAPAKQQVPVGIQRAEFAIAMVLSLTGEPRRHPVETPGDASSGQKSAEIDGDEDHRDLSTWYPDEEKGERAMFLTGSDERSREIAADGPDSSTSSARRSRARETP